MKLFLFLIYTLTIFVVTNCDFFTSISNPKYQINFDDQSSLNNKRTNIDNSLKVIQVKSPNNKIYECGIPNENTTQNKKEDFSLQLLLPYSKLCHFFNTGWWSYQVCHFLQVRQIHFENGEPDKIIKLGNFISQEIDTNNTEPRIVSSFEGGDYCKGSNKNRTLKVIYECLYSPNDIPNENFDYIIEGIKELSMCEYEIKIHIQKFCDYSESYQKEKIVTNVDCFLKNTNAIDQNQGNKFNNNEDEQSNKNNHREGFMSFYDLQFINYKIMGLFGEINNESQITQDFPNPALYHSLQKQISKLDQVPLKELSKTQLVSEIKTKFPNYNIETIKRLINTLYYHKPLFNIEDQNNKYNKKNFDMDYLANNQIYQGEYKDQYQMLYNDHKSKTINNAQEIDLTVFKNLLFNQKHQKYNQNQNQNQKQKQHPNQKQKQKQNENKNNEIHQTITSNTFRVDGDKFFNLEELITLFSKMDIKISVDNKGNLIEVMGEYIDPKTGNKIVGINLRNIIDIYLKQTSEDNNISQIINQKLQDNKKKKSDNLNSS
ncbi:os-9-related [Anaeramoeba flamelloides]|uniref:Os-9-related n=1 Tax=Anaeramoeba flamelloides TaxID=1746091 RepID=A0AAV7Y4W3_9EUKA|nr:os-9-related [Anaeramoeba flamelloides]